MVSFDILKSIYNSVIIFDLTGEKWGNTEGYDVRHG